MTLRTLVAAIAIIVPAAAGLVVADEHALSKAEIVALLSGNTAIGTGAGTPWRQYFAEDGTTPYAIEGEGVEVGRWKVDDDGTYRSWWEGTGWTTYTMTGEDDRVTWITEDGHSRFPAKIVEGNQLED